MLAALAYLTGLILSIAVLAWDADIELAWFGVALFAGLLLSVVPVGPPISWPRRGGPQ